MMQVRAISAGYPSLEAAQICSETLKQLNAEFVLAICKFQGYVPNLPKASVEWHPSFRLTSNEEHLVDWNKVKPLDEALVEDMRECEAVFLDLLTRYEEGGQRLTYQERKREYLRQLRYWNHVLDEKQINLFLSSDIPHLGLTYVLYELCKRKKITMAFLHPLFIVKNRLLIEEEWEKSVPAIPEIFAKLQQEFPADKRTTVPLMPAFEDYYTAQTRQADPTPWYMKNRVPGPLERWLRAVFDVFRNDPLRFVRQGLSFLRRLFTTHYWSRRAEESSVRDALRFYDQHAVAPDFGKRFIYVPLHYQPELSTAPLAGAYVDQLLIVQLLAAHLPADVLLYVKEHPRQSEVYRHTQFYKDLLAIPNVRLVKKTASTFRLAEQALAIAIATGTAGFEALLRGKPVLLFGHEFYQSAPGVFPIRTEADVKQALAVITSGKGQPTLPDMRLFLRALQEASIEGYVDTAYRGSASPEENVRLVARALAEHCRRRLAQA